MKPSTTDYAPRWHPIDQPTGRAPRAWPRYMTARVAADYSDTSPWTIRRNVNPCGRRGRTFIYSLESVEEWMRGAAVGDTRRRDVTSIARTREIGRRRKIANEAERATVALHRSDVAA